MTKPQWLELERQRQDGPQPTYGRARARVQNTLMRLGLSELRSSDWCGITKAGRKALAAKTKEGK